MVRINFFVIKENKYSLSPLISIAEEFPFNINLIKIPKKIYNSINHNFIEENLFNFFNNLQTTYKLNKSDNNIFILSWTSWYRVFFIKLAHFLQQHFPENIILAGGSDATGSYNFLKNYLPTICVGEGELFFYKTLKIICDLKNEKSFNEVNNKLNGIFLNNKKEIIKIKDNKKEIFADLDDIISLTKLYIRKHKSIGIEISKVQISQIIETIQKSSSPIDLIFQISPVYPVKIQFFHPSEITRGCSGLCYFCQTPFISGIYERHKNIFLLIKYLEYSLKFNKLYFRFISPNFLSFYYNIEINYSLNRVKLVDHQISKKHLSKKFNFNKDKIANLKAFDLFLSKLKALNQDIKLFLGTFPSEISINFINNDIIKLISSYSENRDIIIGLQSASDSILKLSGRNYDLSFFDKKLEIITKYYNVIIDLIFGLPFETSRDRKFTFEYIKKTIKRYNKNIKFNLHYFLPLAGTPFGKRSPSPLNTDEINSLYSLIGNNKGFGKWKTQMEEYINRLKI